MKYRSRISSTRPAFIHINDPQPHSTLIKVSKLNISTIRRPSIIDALFSYSPTPFPFPLFRFALSLLPLSLFFYKLYRISRHHHPMAVQVYDNIASPLIFHLYQCFSLYISTHIHPQNVPPQQNQNDRQVKLNTFPVPLIRWHPSISNNIELQAEH